VSRAVPTRATPAAHRRPTARGATPVTTRGRAQIAQRGRRGPGVLHRIFSAWLLGKLLALAILAGDLVVIVQGAVAPTLQVRETLVYGADLVPVTEITPFLPTSGTSIFAVRGMRIARAMEGIPAVKSAEVRAVLPSTVNVFLQERMPVAAWVVGQSRALIDEDGLVLGDADALRPESPLREIAPSLPAISAPEGPAVQLGDRVDPAVVHVAQSVGPRLVAIGMPGSQVEYHPATGVSLVVPGGPRIILGNADDLAAKLDAVQAIRGHLDATHQTAQLIDVRFLERPYYR